MAKSLHLSREVKVYVEFDGKFWEIPVLDGYSFSQGTNITEVTVAEMADATNNSRRGRYAFTDSVAPAEFSFSTYARPFVADSDHHAVEEVLWALFAGAANYDATEASGNIFDNGDTSPITVINSDTTDLSLTFTGSNKLTFADMNVWFKLTASGDNSADDLWYKLTGAVLSEASIDFDIDGIATINWSGMAKTLTEPDTAPTLGTLASTSSAIESTGNFIRNRLTQLSLTPETAINEGTAYSNLVLTGGNISISNNPTFVTPESLGVVNTPLAHVMGTRSVTGSFTCYLNNDANSSAELISDLLGATTTVTNSFNMALDIGGATAPKVQVNIPRAHLEIPSTTIEDVISVEVNFHGLPSDINSADEMSINYFGA